MPLVDNGVVLGAVSIFDGTAPGFSAETLQILAFQARLAASVRALRRSARTDMLTGLLNREVVLDRLRLATTRLERHAGLLCVLYFDPDDFKGINDTIGQATGDSVLIKFGHRLLRVLRTADTLARFGGDEFAAVSEDLRTIQDVRLLIERVLQALRADCTSMGGALPCT